MAAARRPNSVGVSTLPGSLTRMRVKFWLSPMITPSANRRFDGGLVRAGRGRRRERLHAQVFAIAAVGVGIEVADEGAFAGSARSGGPRQAFGLGQREHQFPDATGLGEPDRGPGGIADGVHRGFACFPSPTINRRLALSPAGAWSRTVSLAPALYSPLASTAAAA